MPDPSYEIQYTINIKEELSSFSAAGWPSPLWQEENQTRLTLWIKKVRPVVEIENLQKKGGGMRLTVSRVGAGASGRAKRGSGAPGNERKSTPAGRKKIRFIDVCRIWPIQKVIAASTKAWGISKRRRTENPRDEQDKAVAELRRRRRQGGCWARGRRRDRPFGKQRGSGPDEWTGQSDLHLGRGAGFTDPGRAGGKSSRLQSCQEFQAAFKWSNEGVKQVIEKQSGSNAFYGVVADHINVPREYESAVEAVLGDKLQYAVVKNQEEGLRAIDYLKNYHLGRGSFVPVELRGSNAETYRPIIFRKRSPCCARVRSRKNSDRSPTASWRRLLTPTIETGLNLWKKNGFRGTFVTPEEIPISPQGVLTGGSGSAWKRACSRPSGKSPNWKTTSKN
jgi:hypothetical protein